MATVNKDFKIKSGLIVEGTTATVNNFDVLTKKTADQNYIIDLIGGTATSANEANKVVKRDANGNFAAGTITADLTGDVTGQVSDISNHTTGDLTEGTNKYFTDQRAVTANTGLWDTIGAAAQAATDAAAALTAHSNLTEAHGATGAVVGTTNTQTLTNKTIGDTLNFTGAGAMTINSDSHIVLTPAAGSSVKWGADVLATQGYGGNTVAARISQAVADLVDSAPAALDTLNELAEALGDNVDAAGLAVSIGNKLPLAGGSMTGEIAMGSNKITGLGTPTANTDAATKQYVDTAESDAVTSANSYTNDRETAITTAYQSYADTAEQDAKDYADDLINDASSSSTEVWSAYKTSTEIGLAQQAAIDHADALVTSDVAESGSLYFTDTRAKTAAAALIVGATKTNITITGDENGLTISAENGVADSTTNDLTEGSTNKYFTAQRAVDALEAVVPNFTAVELNSVAKQVAATLEAATAGVQVAHAFAKADYRSAEYLVKVAYGDHTEISKVLLTLDANDNVAITEYGIVGTNGSASAISAGISGANVQLLVTTANNTSVVTVVGTLVA
jgi:hypothetical protein